jgi:lipopolysaccharide biosynthesis glycosyltransferase
VCAADRKYAIPLAVMLRSMAEGLERYPVAVVWVLDGGLGRRTRRRIIESLPTGVLDIRWIRPNRKLLKEMPVFGHVSICTYYRLLLGDLLPGDVEKVIYLDVDTIVLGDIAQLWDEDMKGRMILAVPELNRSVMDMLDPKIISDCALNPVASYFNAGVLMLDVKQWRMRTMMEHAFEFVRRYYGAIKFWDQDVLNSLAADDWLPLDPRWNRRVDHHWIGSQTELIARAGVNGIIHFASAVKPWDFTVNHPARELFLGWVDRTTWVGWRPKKPLIDWKSFGENVANKHWYGKHIRKIPCIGRIWRVSMEWIKSGR